jgi:acyl-CoA synthetase (AMP-forming)/AMP-acid ligase II
VVSAFHTTATTLPGLVRDVVAAYPERDAYVELERRISYAELDRAADGLATVWADRGVGRGDVVCLSIESSIDYAICYHAAIRLGAITSGINLRLGRAEQEAILGRLDPVLTVVADTPDVRGPLGQVFSRSEIAPAAAIEPDFRRPPLSPDDPVTVVWTSGTTDRPKGAVYDHARMAAMAAGAGAMSAPGDRRIYPLPFAHTGYMTRLWDELVNAMTCVITPAKWKAEDSLLLMERERVTVGQGVATQWELMLRSPLLPATDLGAMRIAMMGASNIPPELIRAVHQRIGCSVVVRYTSTEACLTTGTDPEDPVEVVATTVGKPLPGVELRFLDGEGSRVPAGTVGRVQSRSAAMMRGYWRDPERTAAVLTADGWLVTGDLGYRDDAGNVHITGRLEDMYIRGGYNVYPVQVEDVLRGHPAVADVAVVGVPDPVLGEIGHAFVIPADDGAPAGTASTATLAELRSWAVPTLSDFKAPDRLTVVPDLPRNAMGKVDRRALLAQGDGAAETANGERADEH